MSANAHARTAGRRRPRRRPAPRRNAGRSGAGRIQWDRLGRVLFVCVVALLAISAVRPTVDLLHSYRQVSETRQRLHDTRAVNDQLERKVKHLQGSTVLHREARRQGMVAPGEEAWVVNGIHGP